MLDNIKSLFAFNDSASGTKAPTEHDIHLAVAALLLEVGYADFHIHPQELATVATALKEHFQLTQEETKELVEIAINTHDGEHSLHPFVRRINDSFTMDQKRRIIEDMWRVAYADHRLDKYEEHRIRQIAELLYLPHKDFIQAKLRVQEQNTGGDGR